jgi:microcompartment protein CcmL/EutN
MLNYDQRELLEEIEYSGIDVASYMDDLIKSRTIKNLRENLLTLIIEAKHLVEMSEELYEELDRMVVVTEDKGEVGP